MPQTFWSWRSLFLLTAHLPHLPWIYFLYYCAILTCIYTIFSPKLVYVALLSKKDLNVQEMWHFPSEEERTHKQLCFCTSPVICTILCVLPYTFAKTLMTFPASSARSNHLEMQTWPRIFSLYQ